MTAQIVFLNGRFIEKDEARISPDDRGFLFGDGVYEVILSVDGRLFEPVAHIERLKRSVEAIRIAFPEVDAIGSVFERLVSENGLTTGFATVYFQVTRGAAPRSHSFPDASARPTVYAAASRFVPPEAEQHSGVPVITVEDERWFRCDIKAISLLPNVLASQRAKESGAVEALFIRDGNVTEGSHTSFAAVFDGILHTHPENHLILPSVTRKVVLSLCGEMGIPVKEVPVQADKLNHAAECMLLGTTKQVTPVVGIDGRPVAGGTPGPLTRRLQEAFGERINNVLR